MNGDSSIQARITQRDARVARARELLRAASTEQERADAVCEEFDAKLEFDRSVWSGAHGPTPVIAALVLSGRLSIKAAVRIEQANGDSTASFLTRELAPFASARLWLALEALVETDGWMRVEALDRCCSEKNLAEALLLLDAEPLYPTGVALVASTFGRESVAHHRTSTLERIERMRTVDPWEIAEPMTLLSYALTVEEQRALLNDLARRLEDEAPTLERPWERQRALAPLTIALLSLGEFERATPWIERALLRDEFEPTHVSFRYTHAPLFAALRTTLTPEAYVAWEQRFRTYCEGPGPNQPSQRALFETIRGPWREEIQREIQREFDAVEQFYGPPEALTIEQQRRYLQRKLSELSQSDSERAVIERLRTHPALEAELLEWHPRVSQNGRRTGEKPELLCLLLDAASDGNRAAIELVRTWPEPEEVVELTEFSRGLSREVVDELIARANFHWEIPKQIVDAMEQVLNCASDEAIARWASEHGVHVDAASKRSAQSAAAAEQRRAAERWIAGETQIELTPSLIELTRTLRGGPVRVAREGRARVADAKARGWKDNDALEAIELSLVDDYDVETLAMLIDRPWEDRENAVAYRTVVRCAELLRDGENATLRALQAQVIERFAEWTYEYWETAILAAFGGVQTITLEEALAAQPYAFVIPPLAFTRDCQQLRITDQVLALIERFAEPRTRVEMMCELLPFASESARERAVRAVRDTFRETPYVPALDSTLPWLEVEDVIARWDTLAGPTSFGLLDGPLLTKLGGVALVDRVGDALVALLAEHRARTARPHNQDS